MPDKPPAKDDANAMDDLSQLQKALDDLGVKFYTYVGIIQRDAPPVDRARDRPEDKDKDKDKDKPAEDARLAAEEKRKELRDKTPTYATDIVHASRHVESLIAAIDRKMNDFEGKERTLLDTANFESRQAGEEMTEAVDDAQNLLNNVRDIIAERETEP